MARKTEQTKDDRMWINQLIDEIIAKGECEIGTAQVTTVLVDDLEGQAARGLLRAERVLRAAARDGLYNAVQNRLSDEQASVFLPRGTVVSIPARVGVPERIVDPETEHEKWVFVKPLFFNLSWPAFFAKIARLRQDLAELGLKIEAFEEIGRLYEQYPDTATPLEACERAGIDPRQFRLDAA